MLKRKFYDRLLEWKSNHRKECLLVKGARQIGKTFIIDYFARNNYSSYLYVNFLQHSEYREIFSASLEAADIYKELSLRFPEFRLLPGDTAIFLDELQNCPRARAAFKSLAIDGRADVIASGSLLGLSFLNDGNQKERANESIPVGYERQMTMHSLDFEEYLWANGYGESAIGVLRECYDDLKPVPPSGNEKMESLFREYMVNGGMPEVVNAFLGAQSFSEAFSVQEKILDSNLDDIARYAANVDKPKIRALYLSIPAHLARENKKFKFSEIERGASNRKFGHCVDWLRESSLVYQCHNLTMPDIPLRAYKATDIYKLYMSDVGMLCAMMGFETKKRIMDGSLANFAKGGLYENAIMSLLVRRGYEPYYFLPKSNASEIDFIVEKDASVVPIEVKATNAASKSFSLFLEREDVRFGYKLVDGNIGKVGKKITIPHYMVMFM